MAWLSSIGWLVCVVLIINLSTLAEAAESIFCAPGTYVSGNRCRECAAGTYTNSMHGPILMNFDSHRQPRVQPAFLYEGQGRKDIMSPNRGQPQNWLASKAPSTRFKVPLDVVHAALVGSIINMHQQVVKSSIAQFNWVSLADVISGVRPVLHILLLAQRHVAHGKVSTRRSLVVTWTDGIVPPLSSTILARRRPPSDGQNQASQLAPHPGNAHAQSTGFATAFALKSATNARPSRTTSGLVVGAQMTTVRNIRAKTARKFGTQTRCNASRDTGHTRSEDHAACISMAAHEGLVEQSLHELTKDWDLY
ncbi:hypothetical protein PLEOSDRAFT_1106612 [Pleurotus ostreatus PC15]|uniref:Uncharacterized protein n=1 Tax=Pleurotus ostreatus (strain PC15) TaxID=1137138 RepID=A0A067NCF0_PLEO1|nr:hypothetical protein PLEOSDRAFT_1106612 [Pleurotus ostreatus PC15]